MKTKIKILLIFVLAVIAFSACESESSEILPNMAEEKVQSAIKQVSVEQARTAVEGGNAQFLDVRTAEEYRDGHAPKTVNLPLDVLETELSKLDKDKPVYVICQTGRRSQKGAEILNKAGFKDIYNIQGGTSAWTSAGFPIEK